MLRVLQACQHRVGYVRSVACLLTHSATCFLDFICLTPGSLRSSPAPMTRLPTQHPPTTYHELSVAAPALARAHASTNPRQRCRNPHPYHTPQQEQESDWPHCMLLLSLSLSLFCCPGVWMWSRVVPALPPDSSERRESRFRRHGRPPLAVNGFSLVARKGCRHAGVKVTGVRRATPIG